MVDLFGAEIMTRSLIDQEHGFLDFWKSYPPGPRRTAKPQCLAKWIKLGCANNSLHIIAHVHHMKTEDCWLRGFHPMALTYLNQQRWLDFEPPAPKPVFTRDPTILAFEAHLKKAVPMPAHLRRLG
jgi:hypothetical protein